MVEKGGNSLTKSEEPHQDSTTISRHQQQSKWVPNLTKAVLILVVFSTGSLLFSEFKRPFPNNALWNPPYAFKPSQKDEPAHDQVPNDSFLDHRQSPNSTIEQAGANPSRVSSAGRGSRNSTTTGPIRTSPANVSPASQRFNGTPNQVLGGLLPLGLDQRSCLSRYQAVLNHRKQTRRRPSPYLISKLRHYEELHRRCGPGTEPYKKSLKYLKSRKQNRTTTTDCNYVVWIPVGGLGNKMLSLGSSFLYALLTNRVLLVDPEAQIPDLFCEPFLDSTWILPSDFPIIHKFRSFNGGSPDSYGNMLKNNSFGNSVPLPPYVFVYMLHHYTKHDKRFFCDQEQIFLQKVPWLIIRSNEYFIPSLFLIQSFQQELDHLFPEKAAVFHLLGRYLFHPTNAVWGLITRYYKAYLARSDEITGIQIRIFQKGPGPFKYVMNQILACLRKENLLPETNETNEKKFILNPSKKAKIKAVLVASLSSGYSEALREMYREHQTSSSSTGDDIIEVYQPSHEEYQQSKNKKHNIKALAEIYLLSLSDTLVTSSSSTFGYVAQSLGGLQPWILKKFENQTAINSPPCRRVLSMEPCFHYAPANGCGSKTGVVLVPHIQHCEDRIRGLKLVDRDGKF